MSEGHCQIVVDRDRCEGHGQCVLAAAEIFSFDAGDNRVYEAAPPAALREQAELAADMCPTEAIRVTAPPTADAG